MKKQEEDKTNTINIVIPEDNNIPSIDDYSEDLTEEEFDKIKYPYGKTYNREEVEKLLQSFYNKFGYRHMFEESEVYDWIKENLK